MNCPGSTSSLTSGILTGVSQKESRNTEIPTLIAIGIIVEMVGSFFTDDDNEIKIE